MALILTVALGLRPAEAAAQDTAGDETEVALSSVSEKGPGTAAFLEWLVPTAGYAHAGNWVRGVPPALVSIGGLVIYLEDQFQIFGNRPPCEAQCVAGIVLMAGSRFWAIIDAAAEAKRFNARLGVLSDLSIAPDFGPNGLGVGLRIPLGH